MHIEVQVALNFVISYLYNKLPRRRVNIFGEELEKALKEKFQGHWYPEKPFKGSAFRCLKTGDPIDKMLEKAARESGVPIQDILENLPSELAVWVDPGEVSYRIGEKGQVKVLFSDKLDSPSDEHSADREVTKTFNPEAQCFRPIESVGCSLSNLSLSPRQQQHNGGLNGLSQQQVHQQQATVQQQHQQQQQQHPQHGLVQQITPTQQHLLQHAAIQAQAVGQLPPTLMQLSTVPNSSQLHNMNPQQLPNMNVQQQQQQQQQQQHHLQQQQQVVMNGGQVGSGAPSPTGAGGGFKGSPSPVPPSFIARTTTPLTFTTAMFAQTKFGSTKLKTNSKRTNRMSPTEFSNYIKQRAAMQQQMHQPPPSHPHSPGSNAHGGRPLSPDPNSVGTAAFYFPPQGPYAAAAAAAATAAAISAASQQYPQRSGLQPFENQANNTSSNASSNYLSPDNMYTQPNKLSSNNYDQQHLVHQHNSPQQQKQQQHGTQYYPTNNTNQQQGSNNAILQPQQGNTAAANSATNNTGNNGQDNAKTTMDSWAYPGTNAGQYQHLLVAN